MKHRRAVMNHRIEEHSQRRPFAQRAIVTGFYPHHRLNGCQWRWKQVYKSASMPVMGDLFEGHQSSKHSNHHHNFTTKLTSTF